MSGTVKSAITNTLLTALKQAVGEHNIHTEPGDTWVYRR